MTISTFVGRESEIGLLTQMVSAGRDGHGCMAFIEGEAGTGKSFLVQALQEQTTQDAEAGKIRFVYGHCYGDTGGQNAYQPFVEILATLLKARGKAEDIGKLVLGIAKETGNDWLNMIPGIGPAINAGLKTATLAGQWLLGLEGKQPSQAEALASQYVQTIARVAPRFAPLIMLIEDAHWIDEASSRLLLRLARNIQSQPLVIIVVLRPSYIVEGHPLREVRSELLVKNVARIIPLGGLNEKEIETYVVRRFGSVLNPKLAAWLVYMCKGHPLFVTQYLSLLEQDNLIRRDNGKFVIDGEIRHIAGEWELEGGLATAPVPDSIEALLEQRIERLVEDDQEMLQIGAVQGEYFMSTILAGLLRKDEPEVLRRLRRVVEQHRIISLYTGDDMDRTHSDVYAFEHALLQQALYNKLSPRERLLYHRSIAEQMERMFGAQDQVSRKLTLEIAHHYDLGQVPASAAKYYQLAAQSLLSDGANTEGAEIARRALRNIRQVNDADRQHAEILELLLSATRWRDALEESDRTASEAIGDEAETIAARTGDKALTARIKCLRGLQMLRSANLPQALAVLKEALELMKQAGDPVGQFYIMSQLGQQMRSEDFDAGFAMQQEAYRLFQEKIATQGVNLSPELRCQLHMIQNMLGVAQFDHGNDSEALELIEASIAGFREIRLKDGLAEGLNYLGQLYMSMGQFDKAEAAIKEAVDVVKDDDTPHYFTGYNLALLGKIYIEWERPALAAEPMLQGWQESQTTFIRILLPLVKNYYAELLMHPDYSGRDLVHADDLLAGNIEESIAAGYHRSAVAGLSLRGLVALANNQLENAADYSTRAVTYLQKMGTLPALRTEEIYFNHYRVLKAARRDDEAGKFLDQAYVTLQEKAASIKQDAYRKSFLEGVLLSRSIIAARQAVSHAPGNEKGSP